MENNDLYLIYNLKTNFEAQNENEFLGPKYYVVRGLDSEGPLALEKLKVSQTLVKTQHNEVGPFDSVEAIQQYMYQACEEVEAKKGHLISVNEYNQLLEQSNDPQEFWRTLSQIGQTIENLEPPKKKNFLGNLFS